ncbi:MAG TPA: STAS domain-containing protein, partial [Rubrobacter sp.]|nr:STAS domain-containing protein [Rubrobacter sp.]
MLNFSVSPVSGTHALMIGGELDVSTAPILRRPLMEAAASGGPVVLDLRGLTFMDSSGIHAFLDAAKLLQDQGWCLFLHANDGQLRRVMEIAAL